MNTIKPIYLIVIPAIPVKNIPAQDFKPESTNTVNQKWIPAKNIPEGHRQILKL